MRVWTYLHISIRKYRTSRFLLLLVWKMSAIGTLKMSTLENKRNTNQVPRISLGNENLLCTNILEGLIVHSDGFYGLMHIIHLEQKQMILAEDVYIYLKYFLPFLVNVV